MPLSEEELRLLEQMEQALAQEDPKFVSTLRGSSLERVARMRTIVAGVVFVLGIGTGGPAYVWLTWIPVAGMLLVALVFGELASHYPVAGALYQYSKFNVGAGYGWFVDRGRYDLVRQGETPYETEPDGVGDVLEFMQEEVTKLLFWHPGVPVRTLAGTLEGLPLHSTWSLPGLLEVVREDVNKRTALERVASAMGLTAADVAAFGDEHNDREMLTWAGFGVAMGNAAAEVRELADWVTLGCDEDGVAEVIETWL